MIAKNFSGNYLRNNFVSEGSHYFQEVSSFQRFGPSWQPGLKACYWKIKKQRKLKVLGQFSEDAIALSLVISGTPRNPQTPKIKSDRQVAKKWLALASGRPPSDSKVTPKVTFRHPKWPQMWPFRVSKSRFWGQFRGHFGGSPKSHFLATFGHF